jgi:hypothetical protein
LPHACLTHNTATPNAAVATPSFGTAELHTFWHIHASPTSGFLDSSSPQKIGIRTKLLELSVPRFCVHYARIPNILCVNGTCRSLLVGLLSVTRTCVTPKECSPCRSRRRHYRCAASGQRRSVGATGPHSPRLILEIVRSAGAAVRHRPDYPIENDEPLQVPPAPPQTKQGFCAAFALMLR